MYDQARRISQRKGETWRTSGDVYKYSAALKGDIQGWKIPCSSVRG